MLLEPLNYLSTDSRKPNGLKNFNNTCFLNAILQSLSYCEILYKHIDSFCDESFRNEGQYRESDPHCSLCQFQRCILCIRNPKARQCDLDYTLQRLISLLFIPNSYAANANSLKLSLGRQEDVHEFLNSLILSLFDAGHGKECLCSVSHNSFAKLFEGSLANHIYCYECRKVSKRCEKIIGLELPIDNSSILETAISDFCRIETLSGINAYDCNNCGYRTRAQKCLRIESAPEILPIQLKRFKYDGVRTVKLNHFVQYPNVLDLRPYSGDNEKLFHARDIFQLVAVLCHLGESVDNGHYVSYVYHDSSWFLCNDSQVSEVPSVEVMQQTPYMLFYVRCSVDPFANSPLSFTRETSQPIDRNNSIQSQMLHQVKGGDRCKVSRSPIDLSLDSDIMNAEFDNLSPISRPKIKSYIKSVVTSPLSMFDDAKCTTHQEQSLRDYLHIKSPSLDTSRSRPLTLVNSMLKIPSRFINPFWKGFLKIINYLNQSQYTQRTSQGVAHSVWRTFELLWALIQSIACFITTLPIIIFGSGINYRNGPSEKMKSFKRSSKWE